MSSQQDLTSQLIIAGGLPVRSRDLAASIIFAIFFALPLPLSMYRCFTSASKWILLRPATALLLQAIAFTIRAYISTGHRGTGLFIAMQTLSLIGFILVYEPLATILIRCLDSHQISQQDSSSVYKTFVRIINLSSIAAVVMSIIVGTKISSTASESDLSLIRSLRMTTSGLFIVVTVLLLLIGLKMFRLDVLSTKGFILLGSIAVCLLTSGCYKLAAVHTSPNPTSAGGKVSYYLLSAAVEWLATILYFVLSVDQLLPAHVVKQDRSQPEEVNEGQKV